MVRPTGDPVAWSSNLIVTEMAGWPGGSRRLRATDGCGGASSRSTARACAGGAPGPGSAAYELHAFVELAQAPAFLAAS